ADLTALQAGGSIELRLTVEEKRTGEKPEDSKKIMQLVNNARSSISLLLDLNLFKTVQSGGTSAVTPITEAGKPIRLVMELSEALKYQASDLLLYRVHDGVAEKMSRYGDERYGFRTVGNVVYLELMANKYSSYALVYTQPVNSDDDSSSSSSSSSSTAPKPPVPSSVVAPASSSSATGSSDADAAKKKQEEKEKAEKEKAEKEKAEKEKAEKEKAKEQKRKEDLKNQLKQQLDKAIAALPKDLTEQQRTEAIAKLTAIYDKALAALDSSDASQWDKILSDALGAIRAEVKACIALATGSACKVCGRCNPFLGICLWIWAAILVVVAVVLLLLLIVWKRRKSNS
ncbi:MAG: hypothetical protein RR276_08460, partial [Angelakisella sp.]